MAGQILAVCLPVPTAVGALVAVVALSLRVLPGLLRLLLAGYLGGWLTVSVLPADAPPVLWSTSHTYFVKVDDTPRYPRVGKVSISVRVLQVSVLKRGALEWKTVPGGQRAMCRTVHLPWKNAALAQEGDYFYVRAAFVPLQPTPNPFSRDAKLKRDGYAALCRIHYASRVLHYQDSTLVWLRERLRGMVTAVLGNGERAGLLLSMSIGTRDVISQVTENAFKSTGLAHLLVVSGYQVTLVYLGIHALLYFLFGVFLVRQSMVPADLPCALIAFVCSAAFVALAGGDAPSMRAAIAALITLLTSSFERGTSVWNATAVSLLILAAAWPCIYCEPGVQLTYAALIGLAYGSSLRIVHPLLRMLVSCTAASCCTAVVSLLWFGRVSLIGLLLNPIFAPLIGVLSCQGGLLALALYATGLDSSGLFMTWLGTTLEFIASMIRWLAKTSFASFEVPFPAAVCMALAGVIIAARLLWLRGRSYLRHHGVWG